jgi:DNA mismatch repair ATPase MutS
MLGVSLAFAIAEKIVCSPAYTLFVTHYPQLTSLAAIYPNVKNVHLKTAVDVIGGSTAAAAAPAPLGGVAATAQGQGGATMRYLHQVGHGPCDMRSGYGIMMAEACGFPSDLIADARALQVITIHP